MNSYLSKISSGFLGGINFSIEEFTSVTGACVISNEVQNWFVLTGGQISSSGSPVLEFWKESTFKAQALIIFCYLDFSIRLSW